MVCVTSIARLSDTHLIHPLDLKGPLIFGYVIEGSSMTSGRFSQKVDSVSASCCECFSSMATAVTQTQEGKLLAATTDVSRIQPKSISKQKARRCEVEREQVGNDRLRRKQSRKEKTTLL